MNLKNRKRKSDMQYKYILCLEKKIREQYAEIEKLKGEINATNMRTWRRRMRWR